MKHAQQATEYLIVMSIAFILLVPALQLYYMYSESAKYQVSLSQANQIGRSIIENSRAIYFQGKNSWVTLELSMPDYINSVRVENITTTDTFDKVLIINASIDRGYTELVFYSDVNITGQFSATFQQAGIKNLRIQSDGTRVLLKSV